MKKQNIYLICNAHLDPVWLWQWEEGAAEAISTFRAAADLCEKNDAFIFNHNEVILYKWIQEYAPSLFQRIQKLVKTGKWHIMGGWYLQPDCNMPCGESFIRQILAGRQYFKKFFNVKPTTAINFDPFGHNRGLVQILAKSGYDSYLICRPQPQYLKLPEEGFRWIGFDGSEILVLRTCCWYHSSPGKALEKIQNTINNNPHRKNLIVLWGAGNHGGGPSQKDVTSINNFIKETKEKYKMRHSTPEMFFGVLSKNRNKLPRYKKDLNPWGVGCYTSMIRIKQAHRLLENEIYSLEKMACSASLQGLMKYPHEEINTAIEDLMFSEFHDILPGSSIQLVEENSLRLIGHGLEEVSRLKTKVFFALMSGQRKPENGEYPILIYNHHPFTIEKDIECEFNLVDFNFTDTFHQVMVYQDGILLESQVEKESSNLAAEWRKKIVFRAILKPSQINRFDCKLKEVEERPRVIQKVNENKIHFKTGDLEFIVNNKSGLVDRCRIKHSDILFKNAFKAIVLADDEDSWCMNTKSFREIVGEFVVMSKKNTADFCGLRKKEIDPVRLIEDGPVRSVIESVFSYNNSFLCLRYILPKKGTEIELEIKVFWSEKNRILKLSIPIKLNNPDCYGQVAFGVQKLPVNGDETVSQKWIAVASKKDNIAFTCINDGTYGSDFSKDSLRLTLLRSPVYSGHPDDQTGELKISQDRFIPRIDQGERTFRFWFNAGEYSERLEKIDREAIAHNEKPYILSYFPDGRGRKAKPLAVLSDNIIQIVAIKEIERSRYFIVRLFEPTGKKRTTVLSLPFMQKKIRLILAGFEVKTLKINSLTGDCYEVNFLGKRNVTESTKLK